MLKDMDRQGDIPFDPAAIRAIRTLIDTVPYSDEYGGLSQQRARELERRSGEKLTPEGYVKMHLQLIADLQRGTDSVMARPFWGSLEGLPAFAYSLFERSIPSFARVYHMPEFADQVADVYSAHVSAQEKAGVVPVPKPDIRLR